MMPWMSPTLPYDDDLVASAYKRECCRKYKLPPVQPTETPKLGMADKQQDNDSAAREETNAHQTPQP